MINTLFGSVPQGEGKFLTPFLNFSFTDAPNIIQKRKKRIKNTPTTVKNTFHPLCFVLISRTTMGRSEFSITVYGSS